MLRTIALATCVLTLSACATRDVTTSCAEAYSVVKLAQPYVSAMSVEVRAAYNILALGSYACASPEYAFARDQLIAFLAKSRP